MPTHKTCESRVELTEVDLNKQNVNFMHQNECSHDIVLVPSLFANLSVFGHASKLIFFQTKSSNFMKLKLDITSTVMQVFTTKSEKHIRVRKTRSANTTHKLWRFGQVRKFNSSPQIFCYCFYSLDYALSPVLQVLTSFESITWSWSDIPINLLDRFCMQIDIYGQPQAFRSALRISCQQLLAAWKQWHQE